MKRGFEDDNNIKIQDKISKHTLESDEELDENDNGILEDEEITGQEAETISHEGEIQITPFNMKEELEDDGHFDASGTFIFKKNSKGGDNWLEDVDWASVKRQEEEDKEKQKENQNLAALNDELPPITTDERLKLYQEICEFMNPRESVLRALKRLGPVAIAGKQQRVWTRRKDGTTSKKDQTSAGGTLSGFGRLTELANDLLGAGDFDIYQKTKEVIEDFITTSEKAEEEDELDAFAADLDLKAGIEVTFEKGESVASKVVESTKWLMKKGGVDADAEIEGPYTNEDVQRWQSQHIFTDPGKVFIKRQGTDDAFLPLNEIKLPVAI